MSPIIGIDLGTTFSAVGFVRDGQPALLVNGAERIVPSVVGFTLDGQLMVGTPALNQYCFTRSIRCARSSAKWARTKRYACTSATTPQRKYRR